MYSDLYFDKLRKTYSQRNVTDKWLFLVSKEWVQIDYKAVKIPTGKGTKPG